MRFSFSSEQPQPPRAARPPGVFYTAPPAAQPYPAAPPSPPLAPPSPASGAYGADDMAPDRTYHYAAGDGAFGQLVHSQTPPPHAAALENPFILPADPLTVEPSHSFAPPLVRPLAPHAPAVLDYRSHSTSSTVHSTYTTHVVAPSLAASACSSSSSPPAPLSPPLPDIDADLRHPRKRKRPMASGDLPVAQAAAASAALLVVARL